MIRLFKGLAKIVIIFLSFFFILNLAEHLFDMELDSYTIVIFFIVVASSMGFINSNRMKK